MKKYMFFAAFAAMASLFTSCSQEEIVKLSANVGDPIRFTASTQAVETRTVYGDLSNGKWDINWVENDKVSVYCPQASTEGGNKQTAVYTVSASENKNVYDITSQANLCWGKEDMHHFYEVYPASENNTVSEAGILTAEMPKSQKATLQANGYYADMNAALMAGTTECARTAIPEGGLDLKFKPIFTAIDITVSASTNQPFTLQSIDVTNIESETAIKPLAGKFTYDFNGNYTSVSAQEESHNVRVWFPDEKGDPTSIILSNEEDNHDAVKEVKVTVFLRGDFNNAVKVVLNGNLKSSTDAFKPVMLKKQCAIGQKVVAEARNHVALGAIPEEQVQPMSGEWWVSHTPDLAYVSQMSLPGVYDAANFIDHETGDDRAQTQKWTNEANQFYEQMSAYLNAGNRVFDFKPTYKDGQWINQRIMNAGYSQRTIDFKKMVQAADDWLKVHTTEFLIFIMSDYDWENSSSGYGANLSNMLKSVIPANRRLDSFAPDITVSEARGKILVINASPCTDPVGISVTGWQLNKAVKKEGAGVTDGRSEYNEVKSHTYTMGTGKIVVHDYNNAKHTTSLSDETRYDWKNKKSYVKGNITDASDITDANIWFVTSSAYRYNAITFDLTYGDAAGTMRPLVKEWVSALSTATTYKKCGIILQAYAANDGTSESSLESTIWANNYKGNGCPLAPRQ